MLLLAASATAQDNHDRQSSFYGWANRNAPYSNPAPQHAPIQPFNPVGFVHKVQPFGPADISDYGNGPPLRTGFFLSYERLYMAIGKPDSTTIGSLAAEGPTVLDEIPTFLSNSFSTDFLKSTSTFGNRWEFGWRDTDQYGWLLSVIDHLSQNQSCQVTGGRVLFDDPNNFLVGFTDADGDGFDDDLDGDGIFGRDGIDTDFNNEPDLSAPTDLGDSRSFLPTFTTIDFSNHSEINSVEIMRTYRAPRLHGGGQFELFYGARLFRLDDWFIITANGGIFADTMVETKVQNNIAGPQIGARYSHQRGRWVLSLEGRFMPGVNFQNLRQKAEVATFGPAEPSGTQNAPVNLTRTASKDVVNDEQFGPVAELRFQTSYIVTRSVAIKASYNVLAVGGITRASNRIDYTLPNFGITDSPRGEDLFVDGFSLGIEVNR